MDEYSALTHALRHTCPSLELREYEPMCAHTSFRVGGPVRLMALPKTEEEARVSVVAAQEVGIRPFFMGNGSNLLVADEGVEAFVVKASDGLGELKRLDGNRLWAGSGVLLSRLANFALECGLTGFEFAHGIPGSLGGAVTMDAGAYGGEMRQVVLCTKYLNADGTQGVCVGAEHDFSYRHSIFSSGSRFILGAELALAPGDSTQIHAQMEALMVKRRTKQPLEYPSAGSTFKRPEGYFAAALIEECGLKGRCIGGAQVSEKHAGFLINRGGATCADLLNLAALVQDVVLKEKGVALEMEICTLGIEQMSV